MLHALVAYLQVAISSLVAPLRRQTLVSARGVTFIEYALLAAIAVIIAALFRSQLVGVFESLFGRVGRGLNGQS